MSIDHRNVEVPKILLRRIDLESPESAVKLCTAVHQLAIVHDHPDDELTLLDLNEILREVMPDAMGMAYARLRGEA